MTARLRSFIPRKFGTAAEAFSTLVEAAGGVRAAGRIAKRGHAQIQNYSSPYSHASPPLDVIEKLQDATGNPAIIEHLARRAGCIVFMPPPVGKEPILHRGVASIGAEASRLFSNFAAALSDDARVDREEASVLLSDAEGLVIATMVVRQQLADVVRQQLRDQIAKDAEAGTQTLTLATD